MINLIRYEHHSLINPDENGNAIVQHDQEPIGGERFADGSGKEIVGISREPAEYEISICMRLDAKSARQMQDFINNLMHRSGK